MDTAKFDLFVYMTKEHFLIKNQCVIYILNLLQFSTGITYTFWPRDLQDNIKQEGTGKNKGEEEVGKVIWSRGSR